MAMEELIQALKSLNETEVQEVATYIAFLKFRAPARAYRWLDPRQPTWRSFMRGSPRQIANRLPIRFGLGLRKHLMCLAVTPIFRARTSPSGH